MDLKNEILITRSKQQVVKLARWVGKDKAQVRQLMKFFLEGEHRLAEKSAWIIGHCAEVHLELFGPWLKPMIKIMQKPGAHDAVKRNVVRILQFVDIPRALQGIVANQCFEFLSSIDGPIAVRTFSMTVLAKIAKDEPDLKKELELIVRQMLPYGTPAFRSRAKKVLKLREIESQKINPDEEWGLGNRIDGY
jgi:hypothetical protein